MSKSGKNVLLSRPEDSNVYADDFTMCDGDAGIFLAEIGGDWFKLCRIKEDEYGWMQADGTQWFTSCCATGCTNIKEAILTLIQTFGSGNINLRYFHNPVDALLFLAEKVSK